MKVTHDGLGNKSPKWPRMGLLDNKLHIQFKDGSHWFRLFDGLIPYENESIIEPVPIGFKTTLEQE